MSAELRANKFAPTKPIAGAGDISVIERLKPYSEYKDSGLPWLGRVPGHWGMRRTKVLLRERVEKGFPNEPLLAATQSKGVVRKEDYGTRTVTAQKDFHLLKLVEIGDFVISLRSFEGGIEVAHSRGIISPAYTVLEPRSKATSGFLRHFFKSPVFISSLTLFVTGIREGQNIDYERLSRAFLPLPPDDEQVAIVRFLDHASHRLDKAIRAKRKTIALLKEQKQAIIHRAVTRGLNPDVPLKDSGILWLGQIPAHWEVRKLKHIKNRARNAFVDGPFGSSLKSIHYVLNGYAYVVESGFITSGEFKWKEFKTITKEHFYTIQRSSCSEDDIVIAKIGANYGMAGILPALLRPAVVSGNSLKLTVDNAIVSNRFVHVALLSARVGGALNLIVNATAQPALSLGTLNNLSLPVPPRNEQDEILMHIGDVTENLVSTISRIEREIELLREYRTRLIADVVTGKLDVREAAARLPQVKDAPADEPELAELNESDEELAEESI